MTRRGKGESSDLATFRVAQEYYENNKTAEQVAKELYLEVSNVRRRLKDARDHGMVHTVVTHPLATNDLTRLQYQLQSKFELKHAIIVPGSSSVMDLQDSGNKEAVLLLCCHSAAEYLTHFVRDNTILAVPWGRVSAYVADFLKPKYTLSKLMVAPMVGIIGVQNTPASEANTVAARFASAFGGRSLLLAAPALVKPSDYQTFCQHRLVQEALHRLRKAETVLTPIAAPHPTDSAIVKEGLMSAAEVQTMIDHGAVGEISNWWFDQAGKSIPNPHATPVGLGLEWLRDIVNRGGTVVAVVAASKERIKPLRVAMKTKLVNVVVTDSVTAGALLNE